MKIRQSEATDKIIMKDPILQQESCFIAEENNKEIGYFDLRPCDELEGDQLEGKVFEKAGIDLNNITSFLIKILYILFFIKTIISSINFIKAIIPSKKSHIKDRPLAGSSSEQLPSQIPKKGFGRGLLSFFDKNIDNLLFCIFDKKKAKLGGK